MYVIVSVVAIHGPRELLRFLSVFTGENWHGLGWRVKRSENLFRNWKNYLGRIGSFWNQQGDFEDAGGFRIVDHLIPELGLLKTGQ